MKNLVMGAAKGYGWDVLEPFVTSCKMNCPSAELVLIVDDISNFTRDKLIRANVTLENFPAELQRGIPNNTRWKIFSEYLDAHGDCEQIFITDTRDVIFQDDLFAKFGGLTNFLGYATEADDIGGNRTGNATNYKWIADCFGNVAAQQLAGKKIICDGTVIGSRHEMKIFSEKMWELVSTITRRVNFRIHDQAVANYLIHNKLLPIENLIEIPFDDGKIFTMELAKNFSVRGNKILREDGVPAVVHQYDRYEELIWFVDKFYHAKNFQFDNRFTDTRSTIEQARVFCTREISTRRQNFLSANFSSRRTSATTASL